MNRNRLNEIVNNVVDNFLIEYRENTNNHGKIISINENNIKRMISTHSDNGYIVISPCRGGDDFGIDPEENQHESDKLAHINRNRVKSLINDIKQSGFSYTPTYGGFKENLGTSKETTVYERSFIVYNKDKRGNNRDFNELYKFGLEMCRKYNQDSFLVQAPGENPKYITQDGNVDFEFDGGKVFNDVSQEYFTDLHKNTHKNGDISKRKPTRFSFTEAYVNPKPQCYSERHVRWANGEVFI
jgi:hypothetical protein